MWSRKSSSSGEVLPLSRDGERLPLRSLDNGNLCYSSSTSKLGSKAQLNAGAVKTTLNDIPFTDPEPQLDPSPPTTDITAPQTSCRLGENTFKSFTCTGGEVEISNQSLCAEESIILLQDQCAPNSETEAMVTSHSVIEQSNCDYIDHPYCDPGMNELYDSNISDTCKIPNSLPSGDLNGKSETQDSSAFQENDGEEKNITWKSFVCEGGNIEVSDVTRPQDDTIPLPKTEVNEPSQDNTVNSTSYLDDFDQQCQVEHADHPYYSSESHILPVIISLSETTDGSEEPVSNPKDITFKSLHCPGGEFEIAEGIKYSELSVCLPEYHSGTSSKLCDYSLDPSTLSSEDLHDDKEHSDHPYCNIQNYSSPHRNVNQEPLSCSDTVKVEKNSLVISESQTSLQEGGLLMPFIKTEDGAEKVDNICLSKKTSPLPKKQFGICQPVDAEGASMCVKQDPTQVGMEGTNRNLENGQALGNIHPPANGESLQPNLTLKFPSSESVNSQAEETKHTVHPATSASPSAVDKAEISGFNHPAASAESLSEVQQHVKNEVDFTKGHYESEEEDSALGPSGNEPAQCNNPDILKVLSGCPSIVSALRLGLLSPVVRRTSFPLLKPQDQILGEGERSLLAPVYGDPTSILVEHLESPMPRPLFNSTAVSRKSRAGPNTEPVENLGKKQSTHPQSEVKKPALDVPLIPDGPLQQQLRQMAEFLILASGKMDPAMVSVQPSVAVMPPAVRATPVQTNSVSVCTSPLALVNQSINTSGQFERKRDFSVADSCTVTDPLLWNLPPGCFECLPRRELEQRLMSSMIMVEALVQQLTAARAQTHPSAGCPPSDLREKLVQTEHTELSQTTMYRSLYTEALNKIGVVELDRSSLQDLMRQMQDMRVTMTSLSSDTDATLSSMKEIGGIIKEDHQSLVSHYGHMKSLFERSKETQMRMVQEVKQALQQRNDMETQMMEAFTAKEAAFSAMDQLRTHCATEIAALEESVGSQQELLAALKQTYPQQVLLNEACTETLNSASCLLNQTMDEQASLKKELFIVQSLLQKTSPILLKLNEKAAAALTERDEHISARDQALEERDQIEEELNEAHFNLQTAREQISDLNLQVTILTSEMGVLREKLTEKDEETSQLERKVTELSATVSSTLASYTFLEQALAAETTKLQQSRTDLKQAKESANELELCLDQSEQRVGELSTALAQSEEQLSQLQSVSQSQSAQIQQLQDVRTQLGSVKEMNEFLLMENELAREQVAESECLLRKNLQGLRERNIQYEDLKAEVLQLQLKNRTLQQELDTTRSRAGTTQQDSEEKLAQAATDITLLLHTLRGLSSELHASLTEQRAEVETDRESPPVSVERYQTSGPFVNSILLALTTKEDDAANIDTTADSVSSDIPESPGEPLFSEMSAFTRVTAITPKKSVNAAQVEEEEVEEKKEQSPVGELLSDLSGTVTKLISSLRTVLQRKDAELHELHNTIGSLQVEQQAANDKHEAEVSELKHQLSRLNNLVERGNQALQQKAQDEKTMTNLITDFQEAQELLNKHKTDNNELRKVVSELRRALRQSEVETQFLREEMSKVGGQSATAAHLMEEKLQLLKELDKLKASLQEVEATRVKLLERAKRHQVIHQTNQQKSEMELQMLNNMINRIREMLRSLPEFVKNCEPLQQVLEYIG